MILKPLDPAMFRALAEEEAKVVVEFVQVLKQEQEALVTGQTDRIVPLADAKNTFCQQLDRFGRHRLMLIGAAGMTSGESLKIWLSQQAQAVRDAWSALISLAREAQDLNRQNGQLISNRMQANSQALNVLLAAADRASLYGPDGQPHTRGGGRILGKV